MALLPMFEDFDGGMATGGNTGGMGNPSFGDTLGDFHNGTPGSGDTWGGFSTPPRKKKIRKGKGKRVSKLDKHILDKIQTQQTS